MRRKMVLGNWKMNGTRAEAQAWATAAAAAAAACSRIDVGVVPAFIHIAAVQATTAGSALGIGAQNVAAYANGAYTGEVSASMLADCGVQTVLIGHSERRHVLGESDAVVAAKFLRAQAAGLTPVLCLGETLDERERGETDAVVLRQLDAVIDVAGIASLAQAVVAYEPVWAIGTGRTASPEQAQTVHALIRSAIANRDAMLGSLCRILYGGSVKGSNAADLFAQPDVDGGLIGGASLIPAEFDAICRAANQDG
jgi:triosephosphate isomerase